MYVVPNIDYLPGISPVCLYPLHSVSSNCTVRFSESGLLHLRAFVYGTVLSTDSFVLHLCELIWVLGLFLTRIMRLGRKADHSFHLVRKLRARFLM